MERSFILGEISPQINKIQVVSLTRPPTFFSFPFHISHDDQRDPNCWRKASILLLQHLSPFTRTRFLTLTSYLLSSSSVTLSPPLPLTPYPPIPILLPSSTILAFSSPTRACYPPLLLSSPGTPLPTPCLTPSPSPTNTQPLTIGQ